MSFIQSTGFCFTGKAKLGGYDVTRADIDQFVRRNGGWVTPKAGQADILVASRTDTVKAMDARANGKRVISYDEFFQMAGVKVPVDLQSTIFPLDVEPQPTNPIGEDALDEAAAGIEGWGMF